VEGSELRQPLPVEEYCWDATVDGNGSELQKLLYCKRKEISERRVLYGVMILVGAAFLLATLLVYAALPELRNGLHAKYLMAHTASFLVAYVFLGAGQLLPVAHYVTCTAVGELVGLHTIDMRDERSVRLPTCSCLHSVNGSSASYCYFTLTQQTTDVHKNSRHPQTFASFMS